MEVNRSIRPVKLLTEGHCDEHNTYKGMRCMDCELWICGMCGMLNHRQCRTLLVKAAYEEVQEQIALSLEKELEERNARTDNINDSLKVLDVKRRELIEELNNCEKQIEELESLKLKEENLYNNVNLVKEIIESSSTYEEFSNAKKDIDSLREIGKRHNSIERNQLDSNTKRIAENSTSRISAEFTDEVVIEDSLEVSVDSEFRAHSIQIKLEDTKPDELMKIEIEECQLGGKKVQRPGFENDRLSKEENSKSKVVEHPSIDLNDIHEITTKSSVGNAIPATGSASPSPPNSITNRNRNLTMDSSIACLCNYQNRCKKIVNPTEDTCRRLFNIAPELEIFVQYFSKEDDCYIDSEWKDLCSDAADSKKIRICVVQNQLTHKRSEEPLNLDKNHDTIVLSTKPLDELFEVANINTISVNLIDEESLETEVITKPEFCESGKVLPTSSENVEGVKYNLPTSFILPVINPQSQLGIAMNEKRLLKRNLKSQFLSQIYDSFAAKNIRYIGHKYEEIANAILNSYPHLGQNLPSKSATNLWVRSLYDKFGNTRRREDRDDPEVIQHKKSRKEIASVKAGISNNMWGIPNYSPRSMPDHEDQATLDSHRSWMTSEFSKGNSVRNISGISMGMKISFVDRRVQLLSNDNSISSRELLDLYPCLQIEDMAIQEVQRLFGEDFYTPYCRTITSFALAVTDAVSSSRGKFKEHMEKIKYTGNRQMVGACSLYKLVGNVAVLVSEDPREVFGTIMNCSGGPIILMNEDNTLDLCVDGSPFIKNVSPENAAFLWLSAFMIFNIKVPTQINRTYSLLQYVIFNLPETPKLSISSIKVLNIFNQIKRAK